MSKKILVLPGDYIGPEIMAEAVRVLRCVGCGVCVQACPEQALILVRRPENEVIPVPSSKVDWLQQRAAARHLNLEEVL